MKIRYILIGSQFRVKSINLLAWQHDIDCFKMQKKSFKLLSNKVLSFEAQSGTF